MKKILETNMNLIPRLSRLFVALTFVAGSAGGASAQTMGSTLASFNILANPAVTLTGAGANPLVVNSVGTSPGITLTTTDASATFYHGNDDVSRTGMTEGQVLWDSLTNVAAVTTEVLGAATLPPNLPAIGAYGAGVTKITAAANITDLNDSVTVTGVPGSIIIFQVGTFLALTNMDVILAGGIDPNNVYWQVNTGITVVNNDAVVLRTVPGTLINNTGAQDIAITVSGAGALSTGRFVSLQGAVSVTKSAGTLDFNSPVNGTAIFSPRCSDGLFYPSPATGATGTFSYCMASAGNVNIRVYNVIGDLAAKIEDTKAAGQHTSTLDTGRLAPGVYLYILERNYNSGNKTRSKVKKFVVQH